MENLLEGGFVIFEDLLSEQEPKLMDDEFLRENLSTSVQRDLEKLENDAGFEFGDTGEELNYGDGSAFIANGVDLDRLKVLYVKTPDGRRYLWEDGSMKSLGDILSHLKDYFNRTMVYVRHRGDELREIGVDTKDLEFNNVQPMEDLLEDMGILKPKFVPDPNEKITKEEQQDLRKIWKDYIKGELGDRHVY